MGWSCMGTDWDWAFTGSSDLTLTYLTQQHHRHLLEVCADRRAAEPVHEFVLRGDGGEYPVLFRFHRR